MFFKKKIRALFKPKKPKKYTVIYLNEQLAVTDAKASITKK